MSRPSGNVDHMAALGGGGAGVPQSPPSSAWSVLAAHADEDDGLEEEWTGLADGDDWPGPWGAARLGIP